MKKNTERYDIAIPCQREEEVISSLSKNCIDLEIYPIKIFKQRNGFVVLFLRRTEIPPYLYSEKLTKLINNLKKDLSLITIVITRKKGIVDSEKIPSENLNFEVSSALIKDDTLKKIELDASHFKSHVNKQILESDYDDRNARYEEKRALKFQNNPNDIEKSNFPSEIKEETDIKYSSISEKTYSVVDFSKFITEGKCNQLVFNFN